MLGFRYKRASRLFSRILMNQSKTHLSSINPIKVNEVSDSKIKDFLTLEDPYCHKYDPAQPYEFDNNFPPCIKDKGDFTSISLGQGHVTSNVDIARLDCTLHQHILPPIQCEVCLHLIERYYTDIPILQAD